MKKAIVTAFALCTLSFPLAALAFPFGGSIGQIVFCYNNAIYAQVGPPRGGPYIWTPSTKTYQFGPPSHTGQWLLGLAAPPYYCLVSIQPIIVWSGILMTMEGSSGPAAPAIPPPPSATPPPPPPTTSYDWGPYCKTPLNQRTFVPTVDPCTPLTQNLTCDQVRTQGYKGIDRCGT